MNPFSRSFDSFLLALIGVYQAHISPRKGWRCAYSVLHGGPGCSGFARQSLELLGWRGALPFARQRFRECKSASQVLRSRRRDALITPPRNEPPPRRAASGTGCVPDLDCCCLAESAVDCGPDLLGVCDASSCHLGACDCLGCF